MNQLEITPDTKTALLGYLQHSEERIQFKKNAEPILDDKGIAVDPWEYEKYRSHLENCLEGISKMNHIFTSVAKSFPLKLLVDAHFIDLLDLGALPERKISARKITKESGQKLTKAFEAISICFNVFARMSKHAKTLDSSTILKELKDFSLQWDNFSKYLEKDRKDAAQYSNAALKTDGIIYV